MARVTKSKAKQIEVPSLEKDAAERKRLLNVLAQRRYRERRKRRYEELESKVVCEDDKYKSSTTTPDSLNSEAFSADEFPVQDFSGDWDTSTLFPSLQGPVTQSLTSSSPSSPSQRDVSSSLDDFDFPDEFYMPLIELNILKAGMSIAERLDIQSILWDLSSVSPFNHSTTMDYSHLPVNLRPTLMQLTVPHHPVMDMLPWPEVRDKMIMVFSQPAALRPPIARSPTALVSFVYDMEDSAEGIRVTGDDPYAWESWELGQKIFKNWWWAFTKEIVDHSNAVREARGATALTGMILGEVA